MYSMLFGEIGCHPADLYLILNVCLVTKEFIFTVDYVVCTVDQLVIQSI